MIKKSLIFSFLTLSILLSLSNQVHAAYVAGTCLRLTATGMVYDAYDDSTEGQVSMLQDFLIWKKLLVTETGQATGYFGVKTLAAVRAYQSSQGIQTTGNVGPLTKAAIEKETCTTVSSTLPTQTGSTVITNQTWPTTSVWPTGTTGQTTGQTYTNTATNNTAYTNTSSNPNAARNTVSVPWYSSTPTSVVTTQAQPTCTIATDKTSYMTGETIYIGYYSTNASYVRWVSPTNLVGSTNSSLPTSGSSYFRVTSPGIYTLTLQPYTNSGLSGTCTKTVFVEGAVVTNQTTTTTTNTNQSTSNSTANTTGSTNASSNTTTASSNTSSSNTTSSQTSQQTIPSYISEPLPPAPTLSISLNKPTLTYGEQWGELRWNASPDALCDRYRSVGGVSAILAVDDATSSGKYTFGGDETTTFTVTCYRFVTASSGNLLSNSTTRQITVTVPQTAGMLRMRAGAGLGTFESGEYHPTKESALAECNKEFGELMRVSSTSMSCTWNSETIFSHKGTIDAPNIVFNSTNVGIYPTPENASRLVIADATEVMGRFRIRAQAQSVVRTATITRLGFKVPPSVKSVTVAGVTGQAVNGTVNLTGLNMSVPMGGSVGLHFNVLAKMNCVGSGSGCVPANSDVYVTMDSYGYTYTYDSGIGGIRTVQGGSNDPTNNTTEIHKIVSGLPKVSVTQLPLTRLTNYAGKVGEIKVTAGSGGDIALIQIPITLTQRGYGAISPGSVELRNASGTAAIADVSTLSGSGTFVFTTPKLISKGTSEFFTVYATFNGVSGSSGDNSATFGLGDKAMFQWDDVTGNTLNLKGSVLKDWPSATSTVLLN